MWDIVFFLTQNLALYFKANDLFSMPPLDLKEILKYWEPKKSLLIV